MITEVVKGTCSAGIVDVQELNVAKQQFDM